ncbi:hypothetical protein MSBRW_0020 (plasmid) [Methanosarcina barkeri str. Wiesmoor]|uniref:Mobile element protein n=2 Tax=Methanosarcina barkeri TaxID=2208 RepID=A0A0E3QIQ1_METBA|nr:hypothetical protein MSBRW_0020 [Methanosarcina barkeri str. Wiesmoor]
MGSLISVFDIGKLGSAILLAEIGNFMDFSSGDELVSWGSLGTCSQKRKESRISFPTYPVNYSPKQRISEAKIEK